MPRTSYQDVQIRVLQGKVDDVDGWIEEGAVSAHSLRRALAELESDDQQGAGHVVSFRALLDRRGFLTSPMMKPDVGEVRGYKSFEVDGSQYIRLNVTHLNEPTGTTFPCRFNVDDVRVRRPEDTDG